MNNTLTTRQKALAINLAAKWYGSIAEIGGGQEVGSFTMADTWATRTRSPDDERLFALLERRLDDASTDNAKEAAFFLRLLKDPRADTQCTKVLGLSLDLAVKGTPQHRQNCAIFFRIS